ncbi:MAG: peptidylprolyl isomerase [Helicobacteraceae bacterium]|nr:peptidylprolyl isomerase [Helicobacteraceae bacterium]
MITWMQRHRKYLVVTLWISTFAFVGAGFVGWGQYQYGKKSDAIATVGELKITGAELQQSYSNLYNQYNQIFQGNFDQEKAKTFGLEKQALNQIIDQTLILNLANEYNLQVSDKEVFDVITAQKVFFSDGVFDKDIYKKTLSDNKIATSTYEDDMKRSLTIQKTMKLFQPEALPLELEALNIAMNIEDNIKYKILTDKSIKLNIKNDKVKEYWEIHKNEFMSEPAFKLSFITQLNIKATPTKDEITKYYNENKHDFKDSQGVILSQDEATKDILEAISQKVTRKEALKKYIAFKKSKLDKDIVVESMIINTSSQSMPFEVLEEIKQLTTSSPYLKPRKINGNYIVIKLDKKISSQVKTFDEAQKDVLAIYITEQKSIKLNELAESSYKKFDGTLSEFVSSSSNIQFNGLNEQESNEFLKSIFNSDNKNGFIKLATGKIVLFDIVEQKISTKELAQTEDVLKLKASMVDNGVLKVLKNRYKIEVFLEGQ